MVKVKYNTVNRAPDISFQEFCDRHGLTVTVNERIPDVIKTFGASRWYATFNLMVEIAAEGMLTSTCGNGDTPDDAVSNLARQLNGNMLRIGGREVKRVLAPNRWREI